jgi:hypothetical protein
MVICIDIDTVARYLHSNVITKYALKNISGETIKKVLDLLAYRMISKIAIIAPHGIIPSIRHITIVSIYTEIARIPIIEIGCVLVPTEVLEIREALE